MRVEWGVRMFAGRVEVMSEEEARATVTGYGGVLVRRREVGEWEETS